MLTDRDLASSKNRNTNFEMDSIRSIINIIDSKDSVLSPQYC